MQDPISRLFGTSSSKQVMNRHDEQRGMIVFGEASSWNI